MSAYGCCGEYNEHSSNCPVVKLAELKDKLERLRETVAQAVVAHERGRNMIGPVHRLRLAIGWPSKGVPENVPDTEEDCSHDWCALNFSSSTDICDNCGETRSNPEKDLAKS